MHLIPGLVALLAPLAQDANTDWPQYLGPDRDATVPALDTDFQWGEDGPEELWRQPVAKGFGGVAVHGGEVFLLDRDGTLGDLLRVFSIETGEETWGDGYEARGRANFEGTRCVPTVDAERVYTLGSFGQVAAFDREEQRLDWLRDLGEDFGGREPMFGWSSSPVLVDDLLIVPALGEYVGLAALDPASGEERWVTEPLGYSHSTPTVLELLGERWLIFLSTADPASGMDRAAPSLVSAIDLDDGALVWQFETLLSRLPVPPPVRVDDERFFLTGGYRAGSKLMRIAREEGEYTFEELWRVDRGAQVHVPLLHEEHLYVVVNENWNHSRRRMEEGGLLCLDLDGEELWRTGAEPFFGRGSVVLAGEHLLLQDGETGLLHVARATPKGYEELARADLFGLSEERSNQMWAPMALSGRRLLLRSQEELVCVRL